MRRFDVIVLGAGPAGLATALALCRSGCSRVLVIDAGTRERERLGESAPPDLLVPLVQLGLLDSFRSDTHLACPGSIALWGGHEPGHNDFLLNPMGPAWRLERRRFDAMLARAVEARGGELRWETRSRARRGVAKTGHEHELELRGARGELELVCSPYVIDATGPSARFARSMGARPRVDDRLYALARFSAIRGGAMSLRTFVEAVHDGWWYAARLPDERVVTMYVSELEAVRRLRAAGHDGYERALARTRLIGPVLHGLELAPCADASGRVLHAAAISSSLLEPLQGPNWGACGDAASSYDPLAAQGIYKALMSGIAAARRAASALGQAPTRGRRALAEVASFREYCANRAHLYALERRFSAAPFWRVRRERCERALRALTRAELAEAS